MATDQDQPARLARMRRLCVRLDKAHKEAERVCRDITAPARKASDRAMRPRSKRKRKRSRA